MKTINSLKTKLEHHSTRELEGIEKRYKDEISGLREEIAKLKNECNKIHKATQVLFKL